MRNFARILAVLIATLCAFGSFRETCASGGNLREETTRPQLAKGWVIGYDSTGTAVILCTRDGGSTWREQGDRTAWAGFDGPDISAVDALTAWAALGSADAGKILHTGDGGRRWEEQQLPAGIGPVKQIKGLSRNLAWAVTLDGTILHTKNGGKTWRIVEHSNVPIVQVNRMDVVGRYKADIRIVDEQGGRWGLVHSQDNGRSWKQEWVDYLDAEGIRPGLHMVSSHSRDVAWCAPWDSGEILRTADGGATWESLGMISGPNDLDDMCSPTPETLWAVQNLSGDSGGLIFHVTFVDGHLSVAQFDPNRMYLKEGVTCSDDLHAVVVGSRAVGADPSLPLGIILRTEDGGQTWMEQPLPLKDASLWKVSFVGAHR